MEVAGIINKALVITVGTGVGDDEGEAIRSIAHGIVASIRNSNPSRVVFVVSEKSLQATVPEIKRQAGSLPAHEFVMIERIDDVDEAFEKVRSSILSLRASGYEVVVDFTTGTKAMSAGAVLAATYEGATLSYVAGERHGGRVPMGTERVMVYSPVKGIVKMQEKIAAELFDVYQFEASLRIFRSIVERGVEPRLREAYEALVSVIEGYMLWDRFNHEMGFSMLASMECVPARNKEFLGRMLSSGERERYYIADLINNAERRSQEGKYDDAVARLYRTTELIAQYILRKRYGIETGDADLSAVDERVRAKYERYRDERGRIKIGMVKAYELLAELGDEIGEIFRANRRLQHLLTRRNESILAHGTLPVGKEVTDELAQHVRELARAAVPEVGNLCEKARFPKFEQLTESLKYLHG